MNSEHYDAWKKSRQIQTSDVDIADAVMERISLELPKKGGLKRPRDSILLNFIQNKACLRISVVCSGALAGLLRMIFTAYYALFT